MAEKVDSCGKFRKNEEILGFSMEIRKRLAYN